MSPRRDLSGDDEPKPEPDRRLTVLNTGDEYVRLWAIVDHSGVPSPVPQPPIGPGDSVAFSLPPSSRIEARSLLNDRVVQTITVTDPPGKAGEAYLNGGAAAPSARIEQPPSPIPGITEPLRTLDQRGAMPDPSDASYTRYVTISDVPVFAEDDVVFNTRTCPKRRSVAVTGVELDFPGTRDVMAYAGEDVLDIADLTIAADRVTISEPLRFPGMHVTVRARILEFKSDGCIDTTQLAWKAPAMSSRAWTVPAAEPKVAGKPDPPPPVYEADPFVYPGRLDAAGTVVRAEAGAGGANGGDAGNIRLEIGELRIPKEERPALRLIAKGARGQAAEPGGVNPRLFGDKTLAPITRDDIAAAFADAFTLSQKPEDWKWPAGALELFPPRVTDGTQTGSVLHARVFAADQRYWEYSIDTFFFPGPRHRQWYLPVTRWPASVAAFLNRQRFGTWVEGPERIVSDETPPEPKILKGPDAYPGGVPGSGGNGGKITCTLAYPLNEISSFDGGKAGPATAAVAGGPCRNHSPAWAVDIVLNRTTEGDAHWQGKDYVQPTLVKRDLSPGSGDSRPVRTGSDGVPGSVTAGTVGYLESSTRTVTRISTLAGVAAGAGWAEPAVMDAVLRCATDTFRMGYRADAWRLLEPYAAEIAAGAPSLAPHAVQIETLRHRLVANLDYAGHPPGYVPRLSALSSFYATASIRVAALEMVRYAKEAIAGFDKVEDQAKVERHARGALTKRLDVAKKDIAGAASSLQEAAAKFEALAEKVQKQDNLMTHLVDGVAARLEHKVERQRLYAGVMHLLGGALQSIPVFQPYLGLGGSALSTAGEIDFTKPVGEQMATTLRSLGTTVDSFITDNKSLIATDFGDSGTRARGKADSEDLNSRIREAQAELTPPERQAASVKALLMAEEARWEQKEGDQESLATRTKQQQETAATIAEWWRQIHDAQEASKRAYDKYMDPRLSRADTAAAKEEYLEANARLTELKGQKAKLEANAKAADETAEKASARLAQLKKLRADLDAQLSANESKQDGRRKKVEETCQRLAGLGKGIADIGAGIAALTKPIGRDDPVLQDLIAKALDADDETGKAYRELKITFSELVAERQKAVAILVRAQSTLVQGTAEIASSLDQLVALAGSRQRRFGLADPRTRQHLVQLKERATEMMRDSVDSFLAALRYELIMPLAADALDVVEISDRVARTVAAAKPALSDEECLNAELWAALASIAADAVRDSQAFADRNDAPAATVVLQKAGAADTEREKLLGRLLDELNRSGSCRAWVVEDLGVVTDYGLRGARLKGVSIKEIVLDPMPTRVGSFVDLDVRHGGRAVVYERASRTGSTQPEYFFFQSGEDDPRYWSGRATFDGKELPVKMATPAGGELKELVTVMLDKADKGKPREAPSSQLKLAPYDPGLYAELILGVRHDEKSMKSGVRPQIKRLTLELTYSSTIHI